VGLATVYSIDKNRELRGSGMVKALQMEMSK